MAQGVYRIPQDRLRRRRGADQHHPGRARSAAPAGPRRRPSSSGSWTWPPTSSASTRSRSGGATSSRPDVFPYTTLTGTTYDIGDYALPLDRGRAHRRLRRACGPSRPAPARRGDRAQLGIGVARYVEITAGGGGTEYGSVDVHDDGTATVRPARRPTARATPRRSPCSWPTGSASRWSRSATSSPTPRWCPAAAAPAAPGRCRSAAPRCCSAAGAVLERRRRLAAELLEADADDIVVSDDGRVGVAGVPAPALSWAELAARPPRRRASRWPPTLDFAQDGATFPFGAHVAVVEVDIETGAVRPLRHVAVDDCGRDRQPAARAGPAARRHRAGRRAGAVGAVRLRRRRATRSPRRWPTTPCRARPSSRSFETANTETPTPLNPLGAKGIGESGTIGSMPAVQNAVVDALSHLGVRHIDMPCTPSGSGGPSGRRRPARSPWREPPAVFDDLDQTTDGASGEDDDGDKAI